jgi:acyl-lipid omega-6 desaturase (Delta-12 desaturase)
VGHSPLQRYLTVEKTEPAGAVDDPSDPRLRKLAARRFARHCATFRGGVSTRAVRQVATTLAPLAALLAAMIVAAPVWPLLTLLLAIPAGALLVRIFIIQHDCGHGSFLPSRAANDMLGRLLSILTLTPYGLWRREHAMHHASSGHLERRGVGDIVTMTVAEYRASSALTRIAYRIYRNPWFLFGFGTPFYFLLIQRSPWYHGVPAREALPSVTGLNLGIVAVYGTLGWLIGFWTLALVMIPTVIVAAAIGGWLFFIQHQFEETHWEAEPGWDFQVAAIYGSSYYALPRWLDWLTGSIGVHHVHHLNSMIPNYRLHDCLEAMPELKEINRLTLVQSFRCVNLTLWDESNRRLVTFDEARRIAA